MLKSADYEPTEQERAELSRERFLTTGEIAQLGAALTKAERQGLPPAPSLTRKAKSAEKRKHVPKSLAPIRARYSAIAQNSRRSVMFTTRSMRRSRVT